MSSTLPMADAAPQPWYREPWPWLLMAGPAAVIVAGVFTAWLAVTTSDGLVADDYYKRGLAINAVLKREEAAARLGIAAEVRRDHGALVVRLSNARPEALFVTLAHATRAGYDVRLRLPRGGDGAYSAELPAMPAGKWRVVIDDPRGEWRISKDSL